MKCYLEIIRKLVKENERLEDLICHIKDETVRRQLKQQIANNCNMISDFEKITKPFASGLSKNLELAITYYYFKANSWTNTVNLLHSSSTVHSDTLRMQITRECDYYDKHNK